MRVARADSRPTGFAAGGRRFKWSESLTRCAQTRCPAASAAIDSFDEPNPLFDLLFARIATPLTFVNSTKAHLPGRPSLLGCLLITATLVTGCPHNKYLLELTPAGKVLDRRLTFFREDGKDTNGAPAYLDFPAQQLADITATYPAGSVTASGRQHVARAAFAEAMPHDVGGAGTWRNLTTTLGHVGIYTERFRGADDILATTGKRVEAMEQLTDLLIGWSRQEMGAEPRYDRLRKFFDVNFRRDLKNLTLYNWARELVTNYKADADEEFFVRFGQYLHERGYVKLTQLPELFVAVHREDYGGLLRMVQRLVASKMEVPESAPIPQSLNFLGDSQTAEASLKAFIATTDTYQARLKKWEAESPSTRGADKPDPMDVLGDLLTTTMGGSPGGTADDLTLKLSLPAAPIATNGKWDAANHEVRWEAALDSLDAPRHLPVICYASWGTPDEAFQVAHFGKVLFEGDNLFQYCLWRASLNPQQAAEWEALLSDLKPDRSIAKKVETFRFSNEPAAKAGQEDSSRQLLSFFPWGLLKSTATGTPAK